MRSANRVTKSCYLLVGLLLVGCMGDYDNDRRSFQRVILFYLRVKILMKNW